MVMRRCRSIWGVTVSNIGRLVVVGAGGHAKVVIATARAAGWDVRAVLDESPQTHGSEILGVKVVGDTGALGDLEAEGAVIAIGDNRTRKRLSERLDGNWVSIVHPAAVVHESVSIGGGTVVFAGVVIQPETVIGNHVIVNTSASIDHDCRIGSFSHIAPGTNLAGDVRIGEGAFLGIGTRAIPGAWVGEWATIGAGGVVIGQIPGLVTAVGVPAKVIRSS